MSKESEIATILKAIVNVKPIYAKVCNVQSVEPGQYTCDLQPVNGEAAFKSVRLVTTIGENKGIALIPKEDTHVIAGLLDNNQAFIMLYSEVVKIEVKIGDSTIDITDGSIVMNGGNNDGLVLVGALKDHLNAIENKLIAFITEFKSHTHPVPALGTSGTWTSLLTNPSLTQQADIENKKVTH